MGKLDKMTFREIRNTIKLMNTGRPLDRYFKPEYYKDLMTMMLSLNYEGYNFNDVLDLLEKNEKKIDKSKYLADQLDFNIEILSSWAMLGGNLDISKEEVEQNIATMKKILSKEPRVQLYELENDFSISEVDSYKLCGVEANRNPNMKKIYDNKLLYRISNVLFLSDLQDAIVTPKLLSNYIILTSVRKALLDSGKVSVRELNRMSAEDIMNLSKGLDRDYEYRVKLTENITDNLLRFEGNVDYDKLLLCAAYRCEEYLGKSTNQESKTSYEMQELEFAYNIYVDIGNEIGDKKIKFKSKILDRESGTKKRVTYSSRDVKMGLQKYNRELKPSKYGIHSSEPDVLKGMKEEDLIKPTLEREQPLQRVKIVDIVDEVKNDTDKKKEWIAKQKIYFVSPERKIEILTEDPTVKISKGIVGGAFEGYVVAEYEDKGFAVMECIWDIDKKTGEKMYPSDNSTLIVPIEELDTIIKSKKKLDNISTQKEMRKKDYQVYSGEKEQKEAAERKETYNVRKTIRINHGKNWEKRVIGIINGQIDPFKRNVKKPQRKREVSKNIEVPERPKNGIGIGE